jgi:hypothetical protein
MSGQLETSRQKPDGHLSAQPLSRKALAHKIAHEICLCFPPLAWWLTLPSVCCSSFSSASTLALAVPSLLAASEAAFLASSAATSAAATRCAASCAALSRAAVSSRVRCRSWSSSSRASRHSCCRTGGGPASALCPPSDQRYHNHRKSGRGLQQGGGSKQGHREPRYLSQ